MNTKVYTINQWRM